MSRRSAVLPLLALAACAEGPDPLTLVDDVEVVAAVAEPPEVAPGEPFELTAFVGDPRDGGVDVLVWWCPPDDGPCAVARPELSDGTAVAAVTATAPTPVWVLACAAEIGCEPTERDLRDPYAWLQRLPLQGVSAATRGVDLTDLPPDERRANPVITEFPQSGRLVGVAPEETVTLRFTAPGAERASGLSTAGGFSRASVEVASDGTVALDWIAPFEPGPVTLWVVLDDLLGGSVVWTAAASVR